jgi:hypothetical protein
VTSVTWLDHRNRSAHPSAVKRIAFHHAWVTFTAAMLFVLAACTAPPELASAAGSENRRAVSGLSSAPMPDGNLRVQRPCAASVPVDVDAIARFCRRGPKDCNYGIEQMLLELRIN